MLSDKIIELQDIMLESEIAWHNIENDYLIERATELLDENTYLIEEDEEAKESRFDKIKGSLKKAASAD